MDKDAHVVAEGEVEHHVSWSCDVDTSVSIVLIHFNIFDIYTIYTIMLCKIME